MRRLVIDTATAACSVALFEGDHLVAQCHELVGRGHAERLIGQIAEVLAGGRADLVAVDCGPGSFTGIRVGLAAARALGLAWGAEVTGYSAMALLAAGEITGEGVAVAIAGGHGELFVQRFTAPPVAPIGDLASLAPAQAAAQVTERRVIGSGAEALVAARGWGVARAAEPRAADFLAIPVSLAMLLPSPIYGRAPDAQVPA